MSRQRVFDGDKDDEEKEDDEEEEENDDGFDQDLDALRRACMITGFNAGDVDNGEGQNQLDSAELSCGGGESAGDSDSEDDLRLLRSIRSRFALPEDFCEPLSLKPLSVLPPIGLSDSDDDDDFEILQAIRRRFSSYGSADIPENRTKDFSRRQEEEVHAFGIASQNETSSDILNRPKTCESFPDSQQSCVTFPNSDGACNASHLFAENESTAMQTFDQPGSCGSSQVPLEHSNFPESAQAFVDAIKRNRSYQRFLRNKLGQIEAKIEENKKLTKRVKILRDFQVSCKRITGQALSQTKDLRIQLISARKTGPCISEGKNKKVSPMHFGPLENPHVANYKMASELYPPIVDRKNWSTEENENLAKGIIQQIQERLVLESIDEFRCSEESSGSANNLDDILKSIKNLDIPPEMIRQFLPKVNWDQVASLYVKGRSGAECEARWLNLEDPLINRDPWTPEEDSNLLLVIQEKGFTNWLDIAVSLGTNRTPFQCLARYQRSLNASILKREWTPEEDDQLRTAVEMFGERDWQSVASVLEGRTGTQCSNRWIKSLHPTRKRVGKWSPDEDKRLKVAVTLFGAKNWNKIAQFVPGRTQPQCRERWVNCLDPNLNLGEWTEEEDSKLRAAVAEHGYSWSKVALHLPPRTDNQCWRRWKVLAPHEVPLLKEARRLRREAFIGNFVDRESERPALALGDLGLLPMINSDPEPETINSTKRRKRKAREYNDVQENARSKKQWKGPRRCSLRSLAITSEPEIEDIADNNAIVNKKATIQGSTRKNCSKGVSKHKRVCRGKSNCSAPDAESQNILILPPENIKSGTSNGVKTFRATKAKRGTNLLDKRKSRRNALAEYRDELNSASSEESPLPRKITDTPIVDDGSSLQDSTLLAMTNNKEADRPNASRSKAGMPWEKKVSHKSPLKKAFSKRQLEKAFTKQRLKKPTNNPWDITLADFIASKTSKT